MPDRRRQLASRVVAVLIGALVLVLLVQATGVSVPGVDSLAPGPGEEEAGGPETPVDGERSAAEDERPTDETTQTDGEPVDDRTELTPAPSDAIRPPPDTMTDELQSKEGATVWTSFEKESELSEWKLHGKGEDSGAVTVTDSTLGLRVTQCYTVVASRHLGSHDGTVRLSFEWASTADNWWERPGWRLVDGRGHNYSYTLVRGHDVGHPEPGGTRTNVTVVEATVDGPLVVEYLVRPSQYCGRGNHGATRLYVDELAVETP